MPKSPLRALCLYPKCCIEILEYRVARCIDHDISRRAPRNGKFPRAIEARVEHPVRSQFRNQPNWLGAAATITASNTGNPDRFPFRIVGQRCRQISRAVEVK